MSRLWDPRVEQWLWQRRAVGQLAAVLAARPDLPALTWTVGAVGCGLSGQVCTAGGPAQTRAAFEGWRLGLGLGELTETATGWGDCRLRAVARRDGVQVGVTAMVYRGEEDPA